MLFVVVIVVVLMVITQLLPKCNCYNSNNNIVHLNKYLHRQKLYYQPRQHQKQYSVLSFLLFNSIQSPVFRQSQQTIITVVCCSNTPYRSKLVYHRRPFVPVLSTAKRRTSSSLLTTTAMSNENNNNNINQKDKDEENGIIIPTTSSAITKEFRSLYDRTVAYNYYASAAVELSDSYIRNGWFYGTICFSLKDFYCFFFFVRVFFFLF
jgi:hypothetical protein